MIDYSEVSERVFGILKGHGCEVRAFTKVGSESVDPAESRRFFSSDPNLMVTVDEDQEEIRMNKSQELPLESVKDMIRQLRLVAEQFMMNFTLQDYGKTIKPKDFSHEAHQAEKREDEMNGSLSEASMSGMYGSKKTSLQKLESVKLRVRHKKPVEEDKRGARSRNISAIFLEQGEERFKFPHNHLGGARAMARHMYNGGKMYDVVGERIMEMTGQYIKLKEFMRYVRSNHLINEDNEGIVEKVKEAVSSIRGDLKRLSGAKTYEAVRNKIEEQGTFEALEDDNVDTLKELFTVKKFKEDLNDILPIVNQIVSEYSKPDIFESLNEDFYYDPADIKVDYLTFENKADKLAFQIKQLAESLKGAPKIVIEYLLNASRKLSETKQLSESEMGVVKSVLAKKMSENINKFDTLSRDAEQIAVGVIDKATEEGHFTEEEIVDFYIQRYAPDRWERATVVNAIRRQIQKELG